MKKLLCQKGTSAVEFALVLPLLMIIVFGIIEFSFILYNKQIITNASREGARCGIVAPRGSVTDTDIEAVVNNYISNHLVSFGPGTATTVPLPSGDRTGLIFGEPLTVTVTYPYTFLVLPKFMTNLAGGTTLVAATTMLME